MENKRNKILAISRDPRFSPNAVDRDAAIFNDVCSQLEQKGYEVIKTSEQRCLKYLDSKELATDYHAVVSMSRDKKLNEYMSRLHFNIDTVEPLFINSPEQKLKLQSRSAIRKSLKQFSQYLAPLYPYDGMCSNGYWVKSDDVNIHIMNNVVFAKDIKELYEVQKSFVEHGIDEMEVTHNIIGRHVKFYGITGEFFNYYLDDTQASLPKEVSKKIKNTAMQIANALYIDVYGGDCIVSDDNSISFVDFNDWPSFAPCREEAAKAIAGCIN